ncbi:hypothetical protein GC098_25535 [Paenibacillus sp. LMG 31458]|uniref:Uncharacterized protein n=1 Tax=Paenibacillus phytorum TaxID=2654977 RepID=A0ABX1Y422_9BACL|nr:hypothetical protein [Paenibacillus phytorum]NOU74708.1 hypothetical protein [Paenibacillus phytorum]
MPSDFIVKKLGLEQGKEGYWFDNNGNLICYDLAMEGYNTGLLIEKETLEKLLSDNQLVLIWDIYIEKIANQELHEWRIVAAERGGNIETVKMYDEDTWKLND